MPHKGGCFCGAVKFTITAEPLGARYCWCRDCQRIASGMATVNVLFPASAVEYTGPITTIQRVADSGNTVERGFCTECGSQLYSETVKGPEQPMRVRAGTLDDPEICPPSLIIWGPSAPTWAPFPDAMTVLEAGPGSPEWRRPTRNQSNV
ncbi:GFA family protein [Erythrobacter ani]|uniref:GFA family protein n=1 Tax=Erythrobacter ani TaxID=2827235 RepID=A0ABS6SQK3_9SPHN|nr:GFA family protein [Erythrobacter ani]MBV7267096.1 GFA family protein [Erythrobacter ani]